MSIRKHNLHYLKSSEKRKKFKEISRKLRADFKRASSIDKMLICLFFLFLFLFLFFFGGGGGEGIGH